MICGWRGLGCTTNSCENDAVWWLDVEAPESWFVCNDHLGHIIGFMYQRGLSTKLVGVVVNENS